MTLGGVPSEQHRCPLLATLLAKAESCPVSAQLHGWCGQLKASGRHVDCIYDEEDGRTVRRSAGRFRTPAEAWHAGMAALEQPDEVPVPAHPGR